MVVSADTIEIERSFLYTSSLPKDLVIDHSIYHEIGYLIAEKNELRIFKKKMADGWRYAMTVKSDGNLSRKEWEVSIPEWTFNELWAKTEGCRVLKTRHFVPHGTNWWLEIDEYYGDLAGLIRIECEFASEEEAAKFTLPEWAQGSDEITNRSDFKNKFLAKHGLPSISDLPG